MVSKIRNKVDLVLVTVSVVLIACRLLYAGVAYLVSKSVPSLSRLISDILCLIIVTIWLIVFAEVVTRIIGKRGGKIADE